MVRCNPALVWLSNDDNFPGTLNAILTLRNINDLDISPSPPVAEFTTTFDDESIVFDLSSADTNSIIQTVPSANYNYDVEIEYTTNSYRTIATGVITVRLGQTRR